MEVRQFADILAIRSKDTSVAFHARDLEVASIDEDIWAAIQNPSQSHEVTEELMAWLEQEESSSDPEVDPNHQTLLLNVTQICNLSCDYCAAGGDGTYGNPIKQMQLSPTFQRIDQRIQEIEPGGSLLLEFFGGEPMMVPQVLRDIGQYAKVAAAHKSIRIAFKVITNGTLTGPAVLEMLQALKPHVQVSIDGPAELNDRQRKTISGRGSTALVVQGIQRFSEIRDSLAGLEINAVFDQNNTDVVAAWEFFRTLPIDRFNFEFSLTEDDEAANLEFCRQFEVLAERAFEVGGFTEIMRIKRFESDFSKLNSRMKTVNFCGAGKTYFTVDAANNMYTCPWDANDATEKVDPKRPDSLKFYENPIVNKSDCNSCWARFLCGGGCMYTHKHSTGSKTSVNPVFCTRTRSLSALSVLWYGKMKMHMESKHETH